MLEKRGDEAPWGIVEDTMKNKPYNEDPEPGDENDPAYKEEMFETFKYMGWEPEDLTDPKDQQEYAHWLKRREDDKPSST